MAVHLREIAKTYKEKPFTRPPLSKDLIARTYKVKPTPRQRKALEKLVENGGNVSKAMVDAGYSANTAVVPQKLTESKGFLALMDEAGLTEDYLNACLQSDIEAKPANRTPELSLAYKLRGKLSDRVDVRATVASIQAITYVVPQQNNEQVNKESESKAN